jgi:hypothetical protein
MRDLKSVPVVAIRSNNFWDITPCTSVFLRSFGALVPDYTALYHKGAYSTFVTKLKTKLNQTPWPEFANELYRPRDRRLSAKLMPTFAYRGCHMVSMTDPYGRILDFLDRSSYLFSHVASQLYSRGWVHPVPDPLLFRKPGSAENRTRTSGSVARYSDY